VAAGDNDENSPLQMASHWNLKIDSKKWSDELGQWKILLHLKGM
jgi:hypothetical protein